MSEESVERTRDILRADLELLMEVYLALERGGNDRIMGDLPFDEVDGPRELARRIREGSLRLVFR